jgi:signal transduction histidine kinase
MARGERGVRPEQVATDLDGRVAALEARIRELEAERRRVFADAQREADAVFAQYQLSQLLAAGGTVAEISTAVMAEVARTVGAARAAIWLTPPGSARAELAAIHPAGAAAAGPPDSATPRSFPDLVAVQAWAAEAGWSGTLLPEGRTLGGGLRPDSGSGPAAGVGYLAVQADGPLGPGHARYLAGVRMEIAVTLRAAQLRAWLAREQAILAAILEGATDAIVAVDAGRRIIRLNAAAAALVGAAARPATGIECREFFGCTILDGAEPGSRRLREPPSGSAPARAKLLCGARCPFAEVLETGRPIVGREVEVRHRDGAAIPVAASVSRMPTREGGAVGVLRDLREARSLEVAKTTFVAAVSHELRTPLALIDGHAQSLLHFDLDPPTTRRHLERIAAAARRLSTLVDEIIDVGQLEADALVLRRSPVALDDLLRAYAAERAEQADRRPLELYVPRALPPVDVDIARVRQVIGNLVENADRHAGPTARIAVRARRLDEATVVLTVADDGQGIPAEERDHVFERFFRGRLVRESGVAGSGLGLYLCRRIVEAHGGWIRLDATTRGTSISVGLPVAPLGQPIARTAGGGGDRPVVLGGQP